MKWVLFCLWSVFGPFALSQSKEGFVPVDEFQLFYKVYGRYNKPILIINGGPGFSSNYLDELANDLSKKMKRNIILFDPRGTGKSVVDPINKKTINLRNQVSDIEELKNHLQIKKWDVIGHAYGGAIAMLYAHKYPSSVNRLVLSSTIGHNLDFVDPMLANLKVRLSLRQAKELEQLDAERLKGQLSNGRFYKQRFDLLTDAYVFDKTKVEQARSMIELETDFNLVVNQLLWGEMQNKEFDIGYKVKEIKAPVLILHGHQDVIGESVPIRLDELLPNSTLVFLNEAGRYIWLDQPEQYLNYLNAFLN